MKSGPPSSVVIARAVRRHAHLAGRDALGRPHRADLRGARAEDLELPHFLGVADRQALAAVAVAVPLGHLPHDLDDFAGRGPPLQRDPLELHDVHQPFVVEELAAAADRGLADDDALLVHEGVGGVVAGEGLLHLRHLADLVLLLVRRLLLAEAPALHDVALGAGRVRLAGDHLDSDLVAAVAGMARERAVVRDLRGHGHRGARLAGVLPDLLRHPLGARVAADLLADQRLLHGALRAGRLLNVLGNGRAHYPREHHDQCCQKELPYPHHEQFSLAAFRAVPRVSQPHSRRCWRCRMPGVLGVLVPKVQGVLVPEVLGVLVPGLTGLCTCILHSALCTLHSALRTLHFALCTLHFASPGARGYGGAAHDRLPARDPVTDGPTPPTPAAGHNAERPRAIPRSVPRTAPDRAPREPARPPRTRAGCPPSQT